MVTKQANRMTIALPGLYQNRLMNSLMCDSDRQLGSCVALWVGQVLAHRLQQARTRLLDLYAPYGSGTPR